MRALNFLLAIVCVAAGFAAAPALAQESPVNRATTEEPTNECTERIDATLSICEYSYSDGWITLVIRAERPTSVTVTDAGGVMKKGRVNQLRNARLTEGRNTLRLRVTEVNGKVLATIDTGSQLYSPGVIQTRDPLLPGPYNETDVQNAGLGGLLAGLATTGLIAFRRVRGVTDTPRRLL